MGGMNVQNQIKRALSKPESIEYVRQLLEEEELFTRSELAEVVCEEFGFQDPRGQNQLGGCLKALRALEAKGWFQCRVRKFKRLTLLRDGCPRPWKDRKECRQKWEMSSDWS